MRAICNLSQKSKVVQRLQIDFCLISSWCVASPLQLAREVLDIAAGMIKPGVTTEEIDHAVHLVRTFML